jgi:glycosyltransferase involved in cell wall biosynthesis
MTERRLHVVHLLYRLALGGVERQIVNLALHLPPERYRQTLVTAIPGGARHEQLAAAGVELLCMPRRGPLDLAYLSKVNAYLRREQPDIINTRGMSSSVWWQLLARSSSPGTGSVVTRSAYEVRASPLTRYLADLQLKLADAMVCNSSELASSYRKHAAFKNRAPLVIENGVDISGLDSAVDRPKVLAVNGLDPDLPLILSIGRLHEVKAQSLLVEAASLLRQRGLAAQFAIIGDGPEHERLTAQINAMGLQACFKLLGGREEVEPLLLAASVFVLSSRSESFNNALLEALAAGLPCVSTRVSGSVSLLGNGAWGSLVEIGDADGVAQAIERYLADPSLSAAHGAAGKAHVRQRNDIRAMADAYGSLFEAVAEQGRQRRCGR